MTPILNYDGVRLLNVPGAKPVYDEVLVEDCYRLAQIPEGSIVIDVGGFCGEFGIACAVKKKCSVAIFEPSPMVEIAQLNVWLNTLKSEVVHGAVGKDGNPRCFDYQEDNPAQSAFAKVAGSYRVSCWTMKSAIVKPSGFRINPFVVAKLDCEGAEREIFEDESWIDSVAMVLMEFHNKDGQRYKEILERHGFSVEFNDPNPEAVRAIIYAKRK